MYKITFVYIKHRFKQTCYYVNTKPKTTNIQLLLIHPNFIALAARCVVAINYIAAIFTAIVAIANYLIFVAKRIGLYINY